MSPDELRAVCLSLPDSIETFPFGPETSVFKNERNNKIFALSTLTHTPLTMSVKCDPEDSLALQSAYREITPGYHLNKRHWISVALDGGVPVDLIHQLLEESHRLVRPKR